VIHVWQTAYVDRGNVFHVFAQEVHGLSQKIAARPNARHAILITDDVDEPAARWRRHVLTGLAPVRCRVADLPPEPRQIEDCQYDTWMVPPTRFRERGPASVPLKALERHLKEQFGLVDRRKTAVSSR
jgi:hypothetical protein